MFIAWLRGGYGVVTRWLRGSYGEVYGWLQDAYVEVMGCVSVGDDLDKG